MNLQLIFNSFISASVYVLIGVGFGLIYTAVRFFHIAHGIVFTSGAYLTLVFYDWFGFPLFLSILLAVISGGILGLLMEKGIYLPLRKKKASPLILLLASLGIYIILQNIISLVFGDTFLIIRTGEIRESIKIFGARITRIQIVNIIVSLIFLSGIMILLKGTHLGKEIKAISSDTELALASGISTETVTLCIFVIGSCMVSIAGILLAFDIGMIPTMGLNALMMGVVACIIGGIGNMKGLFLGAILIAFSQHIGGWYFGSQWQEAIAFLILLAFLLLKLQGLSFKRIFFLNKQEREKWN